MDDVTVSDVELLVVEDNADDARYLERLLLERRPDPDDATLLEIADVHRAESLSEAIGALDSTEPDVVLLDLMLPDSEGLETVETLVERAPTVPVVVLTGRTDARTGVEAIRRGAQDYLTKGSITAGVVGRTVRYAIDRKRNQREIVDRNHRLAVLNRIVRQDIRNDASMIVGLGTQLRERVDEEDRRVVDSLLEAATHVVDLADTSGTLMDALSGDSELTREPVDLHAVVDAEVDRLRERHEVEVTVEREGAPADPLFVVGTPMLGSALEQLLSNAVRHSDRERPRVVVDLEATPERATVRIADDGVGIPDAQKELLVDPDAGTGARSGMGAGLYLVTTVLDGVGGDLTFEDNHPRGTVATVTLERVDPPAPGDDETG